MCNTDRIATWGKALTSWLAALLAVAWLGWASDLNMYTRPLQAATDQITYNVGDTVLLRIIFPSSQAEQTQARYRFAVRYAGEVKPVVEGLVLGSEKGTSGYRLLWKAPLGARAGRYEIDMRVADSASPRAVQDIPRICSFVIHRRVVQIVSA